MTNQSATEAAVMEQLHALYNARQWDQVIQLTQAYHQLVQSNPEAHFLVGGAFFQKQNAHEAQKHFNNATKLSPGDANAWYGLGLSQKFSLDLHAAIQSLNHTIKRDPNHLDARMQLGLCLREVNQPQLALETFQSMEQNTSPYPNLENEIAMTLDALGEEEQASLYYEKSFKRDPSNPDVIFNLARRKTYALDSPFATNLKSLRDTAEKTNKHDKAQITLNYAFAYLLEKNAKHEEAFDCFAKANQSQSILYPHNKEEESQLTENIIKAFSSALFQQFPNAGCTDNTPIFIVGMPRSGTSLIEQILDCHPRITGAGELDLIRNAATQDLSQHTHTVFPEGLNTLNESTFSKIGETVLKGMKSFGNTQHIVDKLPHNFIMLGLIKLILPNAKIIHCMRDPMDTCWSIWRQSFFARHTYKYTFGDMAIAYKNYLRLMEHWHTLFPGWIVDTHYEDLIEKPEDTIKTILNHCQLEWHEDCQHFHKKKRTVFTASTHQVRQPLYATALNSWAPIKEKLQPLQEALVKHDVITKH